MREKLRYFIINKSSDYNRGIYENFIPQGSILRFDSDKKTGVGRFMTRIFDSGDREMTWHRMIIKTQNCENADLKITIYATDNSKVSYKGRTASIFEMFEDKTLSLQDKADAFRPFIAKQTSSVSDILLHDVMGRYIWALIDQYNSGDEPAAICEIRILLPSVSWIDNLPALYRNSDKETHFLERYLGIFQTIYEELDREIAGVLSHFDPECAESEFLVWLAGWLHISDTNIWSEAQLRKLLLNAVRIYRMRGTKQALSEMIGLYTGEEPIIIEGTRIKEAAASMPNGKALLDMYGGNPYSVTVLIKPGHDNENIRRIAMNMLPLGTELNLVELDSFIFLDNYAYLGVNSSLGQYRPAVLDGNSQLMTSVLGSEK